LRPREPGRLAKKAEEMGPRSSTRPVVLIVEDEILLLMDTMDFLEAAGFEVVDAKMRMTPSRFLSSVTISNSSSPTSICRVLWTD
jgi:hypothetical protein